MFTECNGKHDFGGDAAILLEGSSGCGDPVGYGAWRGGELQQAGRNSGDRQQRMSGPFMRIAGFVLAGLIVLTFGIRFAFARMLGWAERSRMRFRRPSSRKTALSSRMNERVRALS